MELKAKCQLELGDVSASYDTFVECSEKLIRSNGDVTAQAEFLHTAVMIYASKQLYKFVEQVADYGIAVTQKDISNLNEEYFYFLRVKFDSSIVTHNFKGVSDVLHLSPLYFARAPELMSHFVKAVLATAQQSPNSGDQEEILFAVCNDGFRRVIFKALFRLGLTAPTVGALRSDPSKNPFEVAYKIAAKQGDYQTAAAAMFFYAKKARLEAHLRPVKGPNTSTTLSLAKSLYGRALAALRLIDDVDSRWILNTPANTLLPFSDEERKASSSSSSSQQSIVCTKRKIEEKEEEEEEEEEGTAEISLDVCKVQMFGEHKYWDDDESANDVITVERLERVLITVSCEYALASERDNIVLNATAEHNWREQLAEVLAENRLIDEAFLLGKAYPELNVHVFELLKMCVVDPSALAAGEKVHEYLRRFQKADYYKAVLYGIMNAHVGYEMRVVESSADLTALGGKCITTPLWFLKEFLAVCPTDLFDVLLEFDLFYAIDRMLDIADRGDVPYLILERIEHVLRDPSCKAAPDLKESIARKVKSLVAK